jgi:uncharacterized membrane protein
MKGLRVLGHPLHALLSDFPLVLLLLWAALDVAAIALGSPTLWGLARWALVAGLVAGGVAGSAGFIDYLGVAETRPRAVRTASAHLAVMLTVLTLALVALVFRPAVLPAGAGRWLELAAAAAVATGLGVGGWLGGHLVFHHGVGVDEQGEVATRR